MPAGQACGLLSYRWNPSGVARPGWEGLKLGTEAADADEERRHLALNLLAPGLHKRLSQVKGCHLNRCTHITPRTVRLFRMHFLRRLHQFFVCLQS